MSHQTILRSDTQEQAQAKVNLVGVDEILTWPVGEVFDYQLQARPGQIWQASTYQQNGAWPHPHQRVFPADAVGFPRLRTTNAGQYDNATVYGPIGEGSRKPVRYRGLHFTYGAGTAGSTGILTLGSSAEGPLEREATWNSFELDQCVVDGGLQSHSALYANRARNVTIKNSSLLGAYSDAQDHACLLSSVTGKVWIENTLIVSTSMGLFTGGGSSRAIGSPQIEPNIILRCSHLRGDLSVSSASDHYSLIEWKWLKRCLAEGCIFEDSFVGTHQNTLNWNNASGGGQSDARGWLSGWLCRRSIYRRCAVPFGGGTGGVPAITPFAGHAFEDVVFEIGYDPYAESYNLNAYPMFLATDVQDLALRRVTIVGYGTDNSGVPQVTCPAIVSLNPDGGAGCSGFTLEDSLVLMRVSGQIFRGPSGWDGVTLGAGGVEDGAIKRATGNDYSVRYNVVCRGASYPTTEDIGAHSIAVNYADIATALAANMDFSSGLPVVKSGSAWLTAGSTGRRLGADTELVAAWTEGVVSGRPPILDTFRRTPSSPAPPSFHPVWARNANVLIGF